MSDEARRRPSGVGRVEVWRGIALGRACLLPPLSSGGALVARPWLRFHTPLIEPNLRIARIRLSDKTSRLRPRHVVPKPAQTYEPEVPVEVREWIASAPSSPDFMLGAQPPAQPHRCVSVERPIRLVDGPYLEIVRPPAQRAVHFAHQRCGLPIGRSARGPSRPRAECFSWTAGSRYELGRSSPKTFARTCIPGSRTLLPALCRSVSSPRSPSASACP